MQIKELREGEWYAVGLPNHEPTKKSAFSKAKITAIEPNGKKSKIVVLVEGDEKHVIIGPSQIIHHWSHEEAQIRRDEENTMRAAMASDARAVHAGLYTRPDWDKQKIEHPAETLIRMQANRRANGEFTTGPFAYMTHERQFLHHAAAPREGVTLGAREALDLAKDAARLAHRDADLRRAARMIAVLRKEIGEDVANKTIEDAKSFIDTDNDTYMERGWQ